MLDTKCCVTGKGPHMSPHMSSAKTITALLVIVLLLYGKIICLDDEIDFEHQLPSQILKRT